MSYSWGDFEDIATRGENLHQASPDPQPTSGNGKTYKPGTRHEAIKRRAVYLRKRNLSQAESLAALAAYNAERCDPPIAEAAELESLVTWAYENTESDAEEEQPTDHTKRAGILSPDEVQDDEVPPSVVAMLIHLFSVILLTGASKAGKSFFVYQLVMSICAGIPFLGNQTRRAKVLLLSFEMSAALVRDRMEQMAKDLEIPMPEFGSDLFLVAPTAKRLAGGDLRDPTFLAYLRECIEKTGAEVVVFDTLYRFLLGANDIERSEMAPVFAALADLAQTTGAAIVILDHTRKGEAGGPVSESAIGSQIKGGAARTIVGLRRIESTHGGSWEVMAESHFGSWDDPITYKRPERADGSWGAGCVLTSASNARGIDLEAVRSIFHEYGEQENGHGPFVVPSQTKLMEAMQAAELIDATSRDAGQKAVRAICDDFGCDDELAPHLKQGRPVWIKRGGPGKATRYSWLESVYQRAAGPAGPAGPAGVAGVAG